MLIHIYDGYLLQGTACTWDNVGMSETVITPSFNHADYPCTVKVKLKRHEFLAFLAFISLGTFCLSVSFIQEVADSHSFFDFDVWMWLFWFGFMTFCVIDYLSSYLILKPDSLEIFQEGKNLIVNRSDIKGWYQKDTFFEDHRIILALQTDTVKNISIKNVDALGFRKNPVLYNWFATLPDLHKHKKERFYQTIKAIRALGKSPEQRLNNFNRYVRLFHLINLIQIAAFFTAWFVYRPPLTDLIGSFIVFGVVLNILFFLRYPIFLTQPPGGIRGVNVYRSVYLWGGTLCFCLLGQMINKNVYFNFWELPANVYTWSIFVVLSLPLIADLKWKEFPKRFLIASVGLLLSTASFYFYGNIALDHSRPTIEWDQYTDFARNRPQDDAVYNWDENGIHDRYGCVYKYAGAFGTEWWHPGNCPENFQKPDRAK